jgi:hypothetical protein
MRQTQICDSASTLPREITPGPIKTTGRISVKMDGGSNMLYVSYVVVSDKTNYRDLL